jgi:nitrogen regulatory protein PII
LTHTELPWQRISEKGRRENVKIIEAVIRPVKLKEVKAGLQTIGIVDIMERTLICRDRQKGETRFYRRGAEYVAIFVEKVKLEIIAADESVGKIIEVIGAIAKTEQKEDCRILILPFVAAP